MPNPDLLSQRSVGALTVVLAVATVAVILMVLAGQQRDIGLDRSAIGLEGIVTWLERNDTEARSFRGGDNLTRERVGLRIYPLYDVDLSRKAPTPKTAEEDILSTGQRDVSQSVLATKIAWLPTLVVLPKWRRGVVDLGVVHPSLLIPEDDIDRVLHQVAPDVGALVTRAEGFSSIVVGNGLEAQLYSAQLVRSGACTPIIGSRDAMLFGRCSHNDSEFWLLSDPDLLDNHGLTRGDNARIAMNLLRGIAGGRPVLLDLTMTSAFDGRERKNTRTWADLLRFFAPPFTVAWAALALTLGLVLWRAWIRTGPIEEPVRERTEAARTASIDVKARLLRLSRHDDALVDTYVACRVQSLAAQLFGPLRVQGDAFAQIHGFLGRRAPGLALAFAKVSGDHHGITSEAELLHRLDDFERIEGKILDEFGRSEAFGATHPL